MFTPLLLAFRQMADPAFLGPLIKGGLVAFAAFAGLAWLAGWGAAQLAGGSGWLAGVAATVSGVAVLALAFWLFVPVMIGTTGLFLEAVAAAVERRHYPGLPLAQGAGALAQAGFGLVFGMKLALFGLLALPVALLFPPAGPVLFFLVATLGLGPGLFEAVAQRRMGLAASRQLYRAQRGRVLLLGAVLAVLALIPVFNLLVPVLGSAAMVHLLHRGGGGISAEFRG